jgi:broad specificity phosphatase PhoE
MRDRFAPFLRRILAEEDGKSESLVLISHGGLYTCMLPLVLANVGFAFAYEHPFPNTAYVRAESSPQGLICQEWCGTPVSYGY